MTEAARGEAARGIPKSFQSSAALSGSAGRQRSGNGATSISRHNSKALPAGKLLPTLADKGDLRRYNSAEVDDEDVISLGSSPQDALIKQGSAANVLPSIHNAPKPVARNASVEVLTAPHVSSKHRLNPVVASEPDETSDRSDAAMQSGKHKSRRKHKHHHDKDKKNNQHNDGEETKTGGVSNADAGGDGDEEGKGGGRGKDKRSEEDRDLLKQQVNVALAAVREVFSSAKGQKILEMEVRVARAVDSEKYELAKVRRKNATDSLGISFTIPARVMAMGWESGQHLVVTDVSEKPGVKTSLRVGDIVVAVDNTEVHTIEELKVCVADKKKLKFKCIRDDVEVTQEECELTQAKIEKGLKATVKAKVKEQLKQQQQQQEQAGDKAKRRAAE